MPIGNNFGPWLPGLDHAERQARFRSLAAITALFVGCNHALVAELLRAETDAEASSRASDLLDQIPALTRRKMLSTYAALHRPRNAR